MSSGAAQDRSGPLAVLRLPPSAESAGAARRFLRTLLREAGHEPWADAAELALSEVVTNGVLHAHTELVVQVQIGPDEVEVQVADSSPALPQQRRLHDAQATTGRGLELVSALARDYGVRPEPGGKVVWFTVGDPPADGPDDAEDLLAAWDLDAEWGAEEGWGLEEGGADPVPVAAAEPTRTVLLQRLPTTLWLAAREHHHALLRELVLHLAEHPEERAPDVAQADEARHLVWAAVTSEVDRSRDAGLAHSPLPPGHPAPLPAVPAAVDLELQVPLRMGAAFAAMQDALDLAERLAVADRLLVRPGLPEVVAVRDWACEQVVAQLAGVPPSAWPGSDQPRFTEMVNDRAHPTAPVWDPAQVTGSDRGVVAGDDANRIIAVSAPLAALTGWKVDELVGRRVVALIPPSLREAHVAGFTRHLSTGHAHVLGVDLVLPVLRRDGSEVLCHFLVERADVSGGRPVYLAWITPVEG